jgi:hypothetical protein
MSVPRCNRPSGCVYEAGVCTECGYPETTTISHEEMMDAWARPLAPVAVRQCLACIGLPKDITCIECKGERVIVERLEWP